MPPAARAPQTATRPGNVATQKASSTRTVPTFRLELAGVTSPGRVREKNEDSYLVHHLSRAELDRQRDIALAVVADGLGGHEGGEKASSMLVNILDRALSPLLLELMGSSDDQLPLARVQQRMHAAFRGASHTIHRFSQTHRELHGMASTAAAVLVSRGQVAVAHVGDCRVYLRRGTMVQQVTHDHTRVAQLLAEGRLSPQEAAAHPLRHEITQAVGSQLEPAPSFQHLPLLAGDWLIAASDGLHEDLTVAELYDSLRMTAPSATLLAQHLVHRANVAGGSDNCTVVVVRCY
jgi:protein phosphatase